MTELNRDWASGMNAQGASVLELVFDGRHLLSPLHAEASYRQVAEALFSALPKPPRELYLPSAGVGLTITSHDTQALVEAAMNLRHKLSTADMQHQLRLRSGIHALADAGKPSAEEMVVARRVAASTDFGGLCLSAQAVDRLSQPWALPLLDRGSTHDTSGAALHLFSIEDDSGRASGGSTGAHAPTPAFGSTLAVLPPDLGANNPRLLAVADLVADALIVALSRSSQLKVVSARSSQGLRHSRRALDDAFSHLQAQHVLQCRGSLGLGDQLFLQLSLHARDQGAPLWQERIEFRLEALLYGEAFALQQACADIHRLLLSANLDVSKTQAWETLEHYQVFSAATQLMHKLSPGTLEQSGQMLSWLAEQQPHAAEPLAWLAFWHLLKGVQVRGSIDEAATHAKTFAQAALDLDPGHALALTLLGHALAIRGDLQQALAHHQQALQNNPSCALAWSFQALAQTYSNKTREACESARLGLALSPLDPWQYFLEAALAHALLAHQQYSEALLHAQQSLRLCASHAPTLLYLSVAQLRLGQATQAQASMHALRRIWPDTTVGLFKARYWGRNTPHAEDFVEALAEAGMPLL